MTNLNEAIQHCKEVEKENMEMCVPGCEECAKEHGQLAEWLEELRKYRGKIEDLIEGNLTHSEFCFYVIDIFMNAIEKEKP